MVREQEILLLRHQVNCSAMNSSNGLFEFNGLFRHLLEFVLTIGAALAKKSLLWSFILFFLDV